MEGLHKDEVARGEVKQAALDAAKDAADTGVKTVGTSADAVSLSAKAPNVAASASMVSATESFEWMLMGNMAPIVGVAACEWVDKTGA